MKRSGLTLGLAFLATGFLLGCQDMSSDLVTPDAPPVQLDHNGKNHKGGGPSGGGGGGGDDGNGGDGGVPTGSYAGAFTTIDPPAHPLKLTENDKKTWMETQVSGPDGIDGGVVDINFAAAKAKYDAGECWTDPADLLGTAAADALADLLVRSGAFGRLGAFYDKTAKGTVSSNKQMHKAGGFLDGIRIGLPAHHDPIATEISDDGTTAVYEFTGGVVRVWDGSNGNKLFCDNSDNGDKVTATLNR